MSPKAIAILPSIFWIWHLDMIYIDMINTSYARNLVLWSCGNHFDPASRFIPLYRTITHMVADLPQFSQNIRNMIILMINIPRRVQWFDNSFNFLWALNIIIFMQHQRKWFKRSIQCDWESCLHINNLTLGHGRIINDMAWINDYMTWVWIHIHAQYSMFVYLIFVTIGCYMWRWYSHMLQRKPV